MRAGVHIGPWSPVLSITGTLGLAQFLLHAWKLETSGGPYTDEVGSKTLTAVNSPGQVAGIQGNAIDCDDVTESHASASFITNISTTFSVEVWINADDLSHANAVDGAGFFKNMENTNGIEQDFRMAVATDGSLYVWVNGNTNNTLNRVNQTASGVITIGAGWQHVVLTFTALTMTAYVDGVLKALSNGPPPSAAWGTALEVGRHFSEPAYTFDGGIDEVRIYDGYVLTASNVTALYNGGVGVPFNQL